MQKALFDVGCDAMPSWNRSLTASQQKTEMKPPLLLSSLDLASQKFDAVHLQNGEEDAAENH